MSLGWHFSVYRMLLFLREANQFADPRPSLLGVGLEDTLDLPDCASSLKCTELISVLSISQNKEGTALL